MVSAPAIYDLDYKDIQQLITSWGEPSYRATQIWEGLYRLLWTRFDQFSSLPQSLQQRLMDHFEIQSITHEITGLQPSQTITSQDGESIKTLFLLPDGQSIEAVLMRYARRRTLCISTQAGCAMGCIFCATGQMGFRRHLTSGEIVEQVLYYARQLAAQEEQVTNIVVMGMGEPFHNYDATLAAIDRLNHPQGYNFGARRFTISTVGLVPVIERFTHEHRQVNLAISLHAADDILRSRLLPINHKYPLDQLFAACLKYIHSTHRRISFEWALINGINDTPEQARLLVKRLKPFHQGNAALCHVNLIPLNPTQNYVGNPTSRERATDFQSELEKSGIPTTIRIRRGVDIQAGCGQLATQNGIKT